MKKFFFSEKLEPVTATLNRTLERGLHPAKMFEDWINAMLFAHVGDLKRYEAIFESYAALGMAKAEIQALFREAETQLVLFLARYGQEALSELCVLYSENLYMGQYVTSFDICKILAGLTDGEGKGGSTADYSCGAGRLLMGIIAYRSPEANARSFYLGEDMDRTCARMTALNLYWARVNGLAVWGNTLTNEVWEAWEIRASLLQGVIQPAPWERLQKLQGAIKAER